MKLHNSVVFLDANEMIMGGGDLKRPAWSGRPWNGSNGNCIDSKHLSFILCLCKKTLYLLEIEFFQRLLSSSLIHI